MCIITVLYRSKDQKLVVRFSKDEIFYRQLHLSSVPLKIHGKFGQSK